MSVETNKELVSRFYEALGQQNYDAVADLCLKGVSPLDAFCGQTERWF